MDSLSTPAIAGAGARSGDETGDSAVAGGVGGGDAGLGEHLPSGGGDPRLRGDVFFELSADPGQDDSSAYFVGQAEFFEPGGSPSFVGSNDGVRIGDCFVYRREPPTATDDGEEEPPTRRTRFLSAGETLTLSAPAGTVGEFRRRGEPGDYGYGYSADGFSARVDLLPGLVLDIPGDEFPAMTALSVPYLEPMVMLAPTSGAAVGPDVTVEWTASDTGDGTVFVYLDTYDDDFERGVAATCETPDDGSYSLPREIIAALEPFPEDLPFPRDVGLSRSATRLHESEDAVVEISVLSYSGREVNP